MFRFLILAMALLAGSQAFAFPVEVAEAPSTTLSLTVSAIQSARRTLLFNIYELSSPEVRDALIDRIEAGVHVEILGEGQPVGGLSPAARELRSRLVRAMRASRGDSRFYEMTSRLGAKRRFRYDHAKYAVIDGKRLLIGSENYSPTGQAAEGVLGNRGWEVFVHDATIARSYEKLFHEDSDLGAGDLVDLTRGVRVEQEPEEESAGTFLLMDLLSTLGGGSGRWVADDARTPAQPVYAPWTQPEVLEAESVERVTSPVESLPGLLGLIASARRTLDIEQMTFDSGWGRGGREGISPLFEAVANAARRGVRVRVLLNDDSVFAPPTAPKADSKNRLTVDAFNILARREKLALSARIADVRRMGITYIHNKGVLVDGDKTLVSSINWNWNAVSNNREAAVVLESRQVNAHYKDLFESDWRLSEPLSGKERCEPAAQGELTSGI